jgi:hypothetical protein
LHDELLLHIGFDQLNKFIIDDILILRVLFSALFLLHEQVKQADDVALIQIEGELIRILSQ